jgi:glycosyltransferase involved in cell wall biosynthesis
MIIGIDAKPLCGNVTGMGVYARNLVHALQENCKEDIFKFYSYYNFGDFRKPECKILQNKLIYIYPQLKLSSPFLYAMWNYFGHPKIESIIGDVDVAHSLTWLVPKTKKARKIITIYDLVFLTRPKTLPLYRLKMLERYIKYSLKETDAVVAISECTKKDILDFYGVSEKNIDVIYPGIDHEIFKPIGEKENIDIIKKKHGITKKYIYHLGTIEPRKNLGMLLRSFSQISKKTKGEFQLVLSGKIGWKVSVLMKEINEHVSGGDVVYTGFVSDHEAAALYNGAEVFVCPSKYEGFGIPLAEAMACGCPVITSNLSSLPEVAGDAGILIDPGRTEALTDAIIKVLGDEDLKNSMKEKSLERAKLFNWDNAATLTRQLYEKLA